MEYSPSPFYAHIVTENKDRFWLLTRDSEICTLDKELQSMKQSRGPSMSVRQIHTTKYYPAVKRKGLLISALTQTEPKGVIWSKKK